MANHCLLDKISFFILAYKALVDLDPALVSNFTLPAMDCGLISIPQPSLQGFHICQALLLFTWLAPFYPSNLNCPSTSQGFPDHLA